MHNCPEVEIQCNLCRSLSLKRGALKEHQHFECPSFELECAKCHEKFLRRDDENHDCISYLCQQMNQLNLVVQQQNEKINQLRDEVTELKHGNN